MQGFQRGPYNDDNPRTPYNDLRHLQRHRDAAPPKAGRARRPRPAPGRVPPRRSQPKSRAGLGTHTPSIYILYTTNRVDLAQPKKKQKRTRASRSWCMRWAFVLSPNPHEKRSGTDLHVASDIRAKAESALRCARSDLGVDVHKRQNPWELFFPNLFGYS